LVGETFDPLAISQTAHAAVRRAKENGGNRVERVVFTPPPR
jgi:hypothetical protein